MSKKKKLKKIEKRIRRLRAYAMGGLNISKENSRERDFIHVVLDVTEEVLFDILKKGFDAHNFVVGLCSHFRDLMVCQDTATIQLLTVSDNIKARYQEQATTTPLSFLLSALNIGNNCDVNYKTSKNQRLHVELALLKMAHLGSAINMASVSANGDSSKKKL